MSVNFAGKGIMGSNGECPELPELLEPLEDPSRGASDGRTRYSEKSYVPDPQVLMLAMYEDRIPAIDPHDNEAKVQLMLALFEEHQETWLRGARLFVEEGRYESIGLLGYLGDNEDEIWRTVGAIYVCGELYKIDEVRELLVEHLPPMPRMRIIRAVGMLRQNMVVRDMLRFLGHLDEERSDGLSFSVI